MPRAQPMTGLVAWHDPKQLPTTTKSCAQGCVALHCRLLCCCLYQLVAEATV